MTRSSGFGGGPRRTDRVYRGFLASLALGLTSGPIAGAAGLWAPVLRTRLGCCEYHCTLCGQVCPTGAIPRLTTADKERTFLGLAWVDTGRCLPAVRQGRHPD